MHVKIIYTGIDHPNHIKALDKFAMGVKTSGDTIEGEHPSQQEPDCYVIFGSWKDREYWLDPAQRRFYPEDMATDFIGFRCAMSRVGSKSKNKKKKKN